MSDDKHANRLERDAHIRRELDEAEPNCARAFKLARAGKLMLATEGSYYPEDEVSK